MPGGTQSKGKCVYCGHDTTKGAMARHLEKCPKRQEAITASEGTTRKTETLFYLRVQDAYVKDFWLDLEVRGGAKLDDLDKYLRAIWLECCGHLSQFSVGGWSGKEIAKRRRVEEVFGPGVALTHIYDFGTSSETLISFVGTRQSKPTTTHPIALLARNLMPEAVCCKCENPATHLCQECLYEDGTTGMLCSKHVKRHPHDNYGEPIPLVNSPRLGMCGYEGPADPPY